MIFCVCTKKEEMNYPYPPELFDTKGGNPSSVTPQPPSLFSSSPFSKSEHQEGFPSPLRSCSALFLGPPYITAELSLIWRAKKKKKKKKRKRICLSLLRRLINHCFIIAPLMPLSKQRDEQPLFTEPPWIFLRIWKTHGTKKMAGTKQMSQWIFRRNIDHL